MGGGVGDSRNLVYLLLVLLVVGGMRSSHIGINKQTNTCYDKVSALPTYYSDQNFLCGKMLMPSTDKVKKSKLYKKKMLRPWAIQTCFKIVMV